MAFRKCMAKIIIKLHNSPAVAPAEALDVSTGRQPHSECKPKSYHFVLVFIVHTKTSLMSPILV